MSDDNDIPTEDSESSNKNAEQERAFVAANAEYFAQALAPINTIFKNSGAMNIVSEEMDNTIAVSIKVTGEEGVLEVDCITLKPNQPSLQDCINALFI